MTKQKDEEQEESRRLRRQGLSLNQISTRLHVAKSSVSVWVRDIPLPARTKKSKPVKPPKEYKADKVNWDEVQIYYDQVHSLRKCVRHFGITHWVIDCALADGRLVQQDHRPSLASILVENSHAATGNVRKRLFSSGVKQRCCEICGITKWNDQPISFELHHKNGVNNDHRLENLLILCPNCHSQTETYKGRNKVASKKRKPLRVA